MAIPDADVILSALRLSRPGLTVSEKAIRAAVHHARELAHWPADEPAAVFYAFACRPRSVPTFGAKLAIFLARDQLRSCGLSISATDEELAALRMRVMLREVSPADVRDWFAERMPASN